MKLPLVLAFTAMTFLSWGTYGVLLHEGQAGMKGAYLKPFIGVGIAYFLIAVLIPGVILAQRGEKGFWSFTGTVLSLLAGGVGALGALGIILALKSGGNPTYVMPIVFGLAPVVNTLVTATINKTFNQISFLFMVGLFLVVLGAVGVLSSKPRPAKTATPPESHAAMVSPSAEASSKVSSSIDFRESIVAVGRKPSGLVTEDDLGRSVKIAYDSGTTPIVQPMQVDKRLHLIAFQSDSGTAEVAESESGTATETRVIERNVAVTKSVEKGETSMFSIVASMILAAICWGAYGPVLHIGQSRMGGSRLRPFCCVGLAYFFIAVALPLAMVQAGMDTGSSHIGGWIWSIIAGAAGAVGALGIIYAFNFGGKPIFVMPLVFGFAPIINTIVSMTVQGTLGEINGLFLGSLATTIAGAVMVLVFQPRSAPPKKAADTSKPSAATTTKTEQATDRPSTSSSSTSSAPVVSDRGSASHTIEPATPPVPPADNDA